MSIILEGCSEDISHCLSLEKAGVNRIELCSSLKSEGGLTPSFGMASLALEELSIPIYPMVRPRSGNFHYSNYEFEIMKKDILKFKEMGFPGVVFGILTKDNKVDIEKNKELVELSRPMKVTFHRAFDETSDPFEALEDIISLGFDRILTSGQKKSAPEGIDLIIELIEKADNKIIIMPGSGLSYKNLSDFHQKVDAPEYHGSTIVNY